MTVKESPSAVVSDVRCASENRSVIVTGTVTVEAISLRKRVPVTLFVVVAARVYGSAGSQIGTNKLTAPGLRRGHSRPFDIVVVTNDNPARCLVTSATGLD
jgi:hypothetical protein